MSLLNQKKGKDKSGKNAKNKPFGTNTKGSQFIAAKINSGSAKTPKSLPSTGSRGS